MCAKLSVTLMEVCDAQLPSKGSGREGALSRLSGLLAVSSVGSGLVSQAFPRLAAAVSKADLLTF